MFEKRAIQLGPNNIRIRWVKGHVTDLMLETGLYSPQDKIGNDGADTLAVQGRMVSPVEKAIQNGAYLRKTVTMVIQTFMIQVAMARAKKHKTG